MLQKSDETIEGVFEVDIAFGYRIRIYIRTENHIKNFSDGSNLFKCTIYGPKNLLVFATGTGVILNDIPYIHLYHHTLPETKDLILRGGNFRCSRWNYQGTKKLKNFSYCYFTSLPIIEKRNDLFMIAMSSNGNIQLLTDNEELVTLTVYRETDADKRAAMKMLIDSTVIENNHLWERNGFHYERCSPFIYRVGAIPGKEINFSNSQINRFDNLKNLSYIVIGEASSKKGMTAPYEENEKEFIFKYEHFNNNGPNILEFWFQNSNTDQYSQKGIETLQIE